MNKQVGKSDVFTKESLRKLQDKMRMLCIESFNKEYNLTNSLKGKKKGRNRDYHITEMDDYMEMKEHLEKNQERLEIANKKSLELGNNSSGFLSLIRFIVSLTSFPTLLCLLFALVKLLIFWLFKASLVWVTLNQLAANSLLPI